MAGGIQKGRIAYDKDSKKLDHFLKKVSYELEPEMAKLGYRRDLKVSKRDLEVIGSSVACQPDGGLWYRDGILVAAFEGKKQNKEGNAIERWCKNRDICFTINKDVRYVTFGLGSGFMEGEYCYRFARSMLNFERRYRGYEYEKKFNRIYSSGLSWYIDENDFSEEQIREVMYKSLTE